MHDIVETEGPHVPAWHIHTGGTWREIAGFTFAAECDGSTLFVKILPIGLNGRDDSLRSEVTRVEYVPPYSFGLNRYQTMDWQPEVHARHKEPPNFSELTIGPVCPVPRFELVTVMGPKQSSIAGADLKGDGEQISVAIDGQSISLSEEQLLSCGVITL